MSKDASRLVLVVEDDVSVRRPLVKFLEMHGFTVVTAETSDEGLEALGKNKFLAAVVDLRLKRGSGRDVVIAVPAEVPVIIFSGVPSESAELERLRTLLRDRTRRATTVGYGPRFLHSTGQLHKGGAPIGCFLQVVADPGEALPIPGQKFGFGRLIQAQAAGDYAALRERGRPVARV